MAWSRRTQVAPEAPTATEHLPVPARSARRMVVSHSRSTVRLRERPAREISNRVGERPDSRLARFYVGPVHSADGHQYGCKRSDRDS